MHLDGLIKFIKTRRVEHIACCFSGGRDSLVATHVTHELIRSSSLEVSIEVLHVDTTVSIPVVQEYVREVCRRFGWKLVIVKPKKSFWELAAKWGMPTPKRRWCCYRLKVEPILDYALSLDKKVVCFITGLRRSESSRRRNMRGVWRRKIKDKVLYSYDPIIDWSDSDVLEYIERNGLPESPVSRALGFSGECVCGAFTKFEHLVKIARNYPGFIKQFEALERAWRGGKFRDRNYRPFYADGRKLSVEDLMRLAELEAED